MKKIETGIATLIEDIGAFYAPQTWHFLTINGVDLGEGKIELQWVFSKYGAVDEIVMYYLITDYEATVPSLNGLIPSAFMGEREVVDLFGITIEGAAKGLYLDPDSKQTPLRKNG